MAIVTDSMGEWKETVNEKTGAKQRFLVKPSAAFIASLPPEQPKPVDRIALLVQKLKDKGIDLGVI